MRCLQFMLSAAPRARSLLVLVLIALAAFSGPLGATRCAAQVQLTPSRRVPSAAYFSALNIFYEGEYKTALDAFQVHLRTAIRTVQNRWIDSICYYTMVGESYRRLGDYSSALENYTAALRLYVQYSDFMLRIQYPQNIQPSLTVHGVPWGKSTRNAQIGRFPETMSIVVGTANVEATLRQGGVLQQPTAFPVQVQEVVRCVCLSLARRRELMGPLITYDSFNEEVLNHAVRRQGPQNHWSEAWLDCIQGFAYSAAGKTGQAVAALKQSLLVLGQFDHPITPLALLELGHLAMEAGDYKAAAGYYEEATYSAPEFDDGTTTEEAFRYCFLAHLLNGDAEVLDDALITAAGWARSRRNRELQVSLLLLAAESCALRSQTAQALTLLGEAKGIIGRRDMADCEVGSRFHYVSALAHYQRGDVAAGNEALQNALAWQQAGGAKWVFQIRLADELCTTNPGGRFSPRSAAAIYKLLLRDPATADWSLRPLESLAVMSAPHPAPFEHWFEATLQQSPDAALEVADLARRHRFYSAMPLGGRLLALRWLLEAPEESLDNAARIQRQEIADRFPAYAELSRKARQLQTEIKRDNLRADTPEAKRALAQKLAALGNLSATQEAILHELAARRTPADLAFPPVRSVKDVQASLQPGHLVLAFFETSRGAYGWLLSHDKSAHWKFANPALVERRLVILLRALGNYDGTRDIQDTQLADDAWKTAARELLDALLQNSKITFNANFSELTIVPDGLLWYLPFELLPVGDPTEYHTLISRTRCRYAPTLALAIPAREGRTPTTDVGIVAGKIYPSDAPEVAQDALDELRRAATNAVPIDGPLTAPSPLFGSVLDGLVVWDDIEGAKGLLDWSPIQLDKGRGVGSLAAWLSLPWKSVDQFILPGFHTVAESALKPMPAAPGAELFVSTTAMMATGARTILISRWRTGGQTAVDLLREFIQELPYATAADSWQRAVQLVSEAPLDFAREPRVRRKQTGEAMNAENPFFWAGYILVDTGAAPQAADRPEKPEKPPPRPEDVN